MHIDILESTDSYYNLIIEPSSSGISIEVGTPDGDGVDIWLKKTDIPRFIKGLKEAIKLLEANNAN